MKGVVKGTGRLGISLGILGGGQLARMLAQAAHSLGHRPFCLTPASDDPAAQVCRDSIFGSPDDLETLRRFFTQADLVAFENEFVDTSLISKALSALEGAGLKTPEVFPSVSVIHELQDKLRQKRLLERLGIPSASYHEISNTVKTKELDSVLKEFPQGCVIKWARLGYDGKGTYFPGAGGSSEPGLNTFFEQARRIDVPVFVESRVEFIRELAIVGVRSVTGEFASYPLTVSEQSAGICRWTLTPASHVGVSKELGKEAARYAKAIAEGVGIVGCFAIELFETKEGRLLVNELAPRVHNTGHFSLNTGATSQFENHWRALLGMPLGTTEFEGVALMRNLIGETADVSRLPPNAHLHWYGKTELRAGRKMGHLNLLLPSSAKADEIARARKRLNEV